MDTLWTVLGYASIGLVVVSAWSMLRSLGHDRPVRPRGLALTAVIAVGVLVVYDLVIPGSPDGWAWGLGAAGLAAGGLVSRATRLSVSDGEVLGRPSPWLVVQWTGLFTVAQLAALGVLFDRAGAGVGALYLGTGTAVGGAVVLLRRRSLVARHLAPGAGLCPHCHAPLTLGGDRCDGCHWRVRTRAHRASWAPPTTAREG